MNRFAIKLGASTLILLLFLSFTSLSAQSLEVSDGQTIYKKETVPAVQVILDPTTDDVKDAWEDFVKDQHDVNMKGTGLFSNKDVLTAEEVNISSISPKTLNLYTKIVEKGDDTEMSVFGRFGYDIYISKDAYPQEYAKMQMMVKTFLNNYLPTYYQEQLEEIREEVEDLGKDRTKLEEDIVKNKEEIEELKRENEKMEVELATKKEKLTQARKTLDEREEKLATINHKLSRINQ